MAARRLVLHFDLNRTVLMSDAAGGRTMENTVNYLLAEVCWGTVQTSEESGTRSWTAVGDTPSVAAPADGLVTYKAFVDEELPFLKKGVDSPPEGFADVKAYNKSQKKQRTALQSAFTSPDAPGAPLAPHCGTTVQALHFPTPEQAAAAREVAATLEDGALKEFWSEGKLFLLPSFLQFLLHVQAHPTFQVSLVFRTFGVDILEVAKELRVFAEGRHPLFPGQALSPELALEEPFGVFYRDGFGSDGLALAMGTVEKVPSAEVGLAFYDTMEGVSVVRGFADCKAAVDQQLEQRRVLGLRDYWEWWSAHGEDCDYGKILLVDEEAADGAHQIFFDDHVEAHHAHIVDVRSLQTGEPVPFERAIGRYMMRAEPYLAISDEQYFINEFERIAASLS